MWALTKAFNGKTLQHMTKIDKLFMFLKTQNWPQGVVCPHVPEICVCLRPLSSNIFSETSRPIKAKFYVEPSWEGGHEFIRMVLVTCQIWQRCPNIVKPFKKFLLQSQMFDNLEARHGPLETQGLQSLHN